MMYPVYPEPSHAQNKQWCLSSHPTYNEHAISPEFQQSIGWEMGEQQRILKYSSTVSLNFTAAVAAAAAATAAAAAAAAEVGLYLFLGT